MDKANKGTYEHYVPGAGQQITYGQQPGATKPAGSTQQQ